MIGEDQQPVSGISLMDRDERNTVENFSRGRIRPLPEKSLYHMIEEQENGSIVDGENGSEYRLDDLKHDAEKSMPRSGERSALSQSFVSGVMQSLQLFTESSAAATPICPSPRSFRRRGSHRFSGSAAVILC